jgi:hypothetical protein
MLIVGSLLASGVAQTSKGTLVGVARDASGAVVVNATVTVVGNSDGQPAALRPNRMVAIVWRRSTLKVILWYPLRLSVEPREFS